ncbi:Leucine Rich Repeat [Seminavis robusta]|uniref:Leucine Rich Repeat n=1 Tax=Seminavis robusta TaxID=568900 RepID=A0A9N8DHV8_9STRA|nr:Leucine Rich Repeat [Seminavis robusta]|eukprot:Sro73_g040270.1 Leucine Rich Repeat (466) ;mRNA; f:28498-29895
MSSPRDNRKKPPPSSSSDNRKKPPPPARTAAPSLMGDASLPGAFPQGGGLGADIEMSPMSRRLSAENFKNNSRPTGESRPGAVAMSGMASGGGSSKDLKSESSKTDSTRDTEPSVNDDNGALVVMMPPPDEGLEDDYMRRKKMTMATAVGFLVIIAIIIVVVVVVVATGSSEDDNAMAQVEPDKGNTLDPRLLMPSLPDATVDAIVNDPHSAQHQAYDWLLRDPTLADYEEWRLLQRFVLVVLYYAFDGPDWSRVAMKVTRYRDYRFPECTWGEPFYGDYCNENGQVVRLAFQNIRQLDPIPPELSLLSNLQMLEFDDQNNIKGTIEKFLSLLPANLTEAFPSLHTFTLPHSELVGTIPGALLSTLAPTLRKLDLRENYFTGAVPSELGLLHKLESLSLTMNKLEGDLPEELGTLTALKEFTSDQNPDIEAILPSGFCSEESNLTTLITDWCPTVEQCCSTVGHN